MYAANNEPSLDELLTDQVALLMMRGDRLRPEQVRSCFGAMQERLRIMGTIEQRIADVAGVALAQPTEPAYACFCL